MSQNEVATIATHESKPFEIEVLNLHICLGLFKRKDCRQLKEKLKRESRERRKKTQLINNNNNDDNITETKNKQNTEQFKDIR